VAAEHRQRPFGEQVAFFRNKLNLPTESWTDLWQQGHDHAFVVAGANRDELLADFRQAVDQAISQGTTLAEFRQDFDRIVARHGWSYRGGRGWRSRVIYDTNMRTSYAAGRYAQLQQVKQDRPYWQFVHTPVQDPRPQHVAWDGLVLHADDPWWQVHYPPDGWGCQCVVNSLAGRDLQHMGKSGPDRAPRVRYRKVTVGRNGPAPRTVRVPEGVDPGFAYAPGATTWAKVATSAAAAEGQLPPSAWTDLAGMTWRGAGRPDNLVPANAPATESGPVNTPAAIADAANQALGGELKLYQPAGVPVLLDAQTLPKQTLARDGARLPWLTDTLDAPQEVWASIVRKGPHYRTRVRVLKSYSDGDTTWYVIAESGNGVLTRWRVTGDRARWDNARQGKLLFGGD